MLLPIRKWRDIKGYEGLYQVSNLGEVKSFNYRGGSKVRILKLINTGNGYKQVVLSKNNNKKKVLVHRLVAEAFIPNPNNLPVVNHKDENPSNNLYTNLEWCTIKYNNNYGTRKQRVSKTLKGRRLSEETKKKISEINKGKKLSEETKKKIGNASRNRKHTEEARKRMSEAKSKKVKCITTGEIFNSTLEASKYYSISRQNINSCLVGRNKSAGKDKDGNKLIWKYLD